MTVTRFRFETAFDGGGARLEAERAAQLDTAVALARSEGETIGFARGHAQAQSEIEAATLACCGRIGSAVADALTLTDQVQRQTQAQAARIAVQIAERLSAGLVHRLAADRVLALVDSVLADVIAEPRLVVRVANGLLDQVKPRVEADAARLGFAGRLIFLGEPSYADHDVLVEWAGGGLDGRLAPITEQITAEIDAFIAAALQPDRPHLEG